VTTKAKRSIAQFRLRTGNTIGARVTLRGDRMWDFLERLDPHRAARIATFTACRPSRSTGAATTHWGFGSKLAFPENRLRQGGPSPGLEISIVTTAKTDEESKRLLELLGMPFAG